MILRLLILSAIMPPTGETRTEGIKAQAVTVPKSAAEPVRFIRYSGSANRIVALPNSEIIWPITTSVKSLVKSFLFIIFPPFHTKQRYVFL